ncbi:hypothetical protein HY091_00470 [Candidatus Kaiserbacteria bacterium]|nr:hypothetical protein [Candidatus Kaiserbacteria bacterium]
MSRATLLILVSLTLPFGALAAGAPSSFVAARSLLVASSTSANVYAVGVSVVVTAPSRADLSAAGGSVVVAAPVSGDALVVGGTAALRSPVSGDLRALAGALTVSGPVSGDLFALAGSVHTARTVGGSAFVAGADVAFLGGARGPVMIYGNTVTLGGDFGSDVHVVASGRISLAAGTHIRGALSYQSPEAAIVPADAVVEGGVEYTGSSYLPTTSEARALALAGFGVFLFARVLAALILAGLLAGLFPRLAELVALKAERGSARSILLTLLLGFAAVVATPALLVLLSLTFVGFGIALLILVAYALLVLLSFVYAGILVGALLAWRFRHRQTVLWHDGVLGMLILSLFSLLPILGWPILLLLCAFAAGALLLLFFRFTFPHDSDTTEML